MIFSFTNKTQKEKDKLIGEGYALFCERAKKGLNTFIGDAPKEESKKSYGQLKALYKLFQLALPYFQKWNPKVIWSLEGIKEFAKAELGYTRKPTGFEISMMIKQSGFKPKDEAEKKRMVKFCKKIKQNISFADFTKDQAWNFAKEFEVWCHEKGWSDVYLTDQEKKLFGPLWKRNYKQQ